MTRPELQELPRVSAADVYKQGRHAARLIRLPHGVEFSYTDDYLDDPGPPVATTLPVSDQPVVTAAGAVPPYFAGLLPEGRRLTALRRAVKTSADDDLSLLLAVGADAIGDVQVLPAGATPQVTEPVVAVTDFRGAAVPRRAFVEFGSSLRMPERAVTTVLDDLCDRADKWLPHLDSLPFPRNQLRKLRRTIDYRRQLLRGSAV